MRDIEQSNTMIHLLRSVDFGKGNLVFGIQLLRYFTSRVHTQYTAQAKNRNDQEVTPGLFRSPEAKNLRLIRTQWKLTGNIGPTK